ncbi:hypothetical protein A3Q56_04579 [Intoshia linei]|uniref:Uncharacterized protein n=1 Tax=Intoshia linei TaxID=1819745 RepID=A0A177B241_9BILA|nr:hypothetical protein A3Q56_04579 [Intoshia linei]
MHSWSKLHGHNYQDEGLIVGQHPIFLSMIFNNSGNQLLDFSLGPSMAHYLADQFRSIKKTTFIKEINNFKYHRFLKPKETLNLDTSENELMKSVNEK